MRRLMLLRHAKTETDAPSGRDQDRRLDPRGHHDAADIGGWIAKHPPFPDLVLVSQAVRARQTWEHAWEAMKADVPPPRVEWLPELYGAEIGQLLHSVRIADGTNPKQMMVVGHNPGLHEFALTLTGGGDAAARNILAQNLPTSGLAVLDFAIDDWTDMAFGRGQLVQFVSPKLLKRGTDD